MTRRSAAPVALALVLAVAGCGRGRAVIEGAPPAPTPAARAVTFTLTITGAADMNRGNAVVARVYALRGASALASATLPELWAEDGAVLGGDVVRREEVRLFPGEEQRVTFEIAPEVTALAVVANLREPAGRGWQRVFPVGELRGSGASVTIGADRVVASGD